MQHDHPPIPGVTTVTPTANIRLRVHGGRAKCLQRLVRLGLPVPRTEAIDFATVAEIAAGHPVDAAAILEGFGPDPLVSVRPSSASPDWGGPSSILNIGMCDARHAALTATLGRAAADALYARFIQSFSVQVARLNPAHFERGAEIPAMLAAYEEEVDEPFPQDPAAQLSAVLTSMVRAWDGTTARLLRQARGAPPDAGLGLVVQEMVLGVGDPAHGELGSGVIQFVSSETGLPQITGRYLRQSQGREALVKGAGAFYLNRDARGPSLEEERPEMLAELQSFGALCRGRLREEMQIEFTVTHGVLHILDAVRVKRAARAAIRIAVTLATDGIIPESEAVLRVRPRDLLDVLHRQVDPVARMPVIATGIPASPGAATGRLVFTSADAQRAAAREENVILARRETASDDVLGMHAARGILTERGGVTSHAAVIARGLGLPCVVGASAITIDRRRRCFRTAEGRVFREGDW